MDSIACIGNFSIDRQESRAFAALSGDHNPVHVDPVQARRTVFHGSVAHGIHVLLRSLDYLLLNCGEAQVQIKSISAEFALPARSGTPLTVKLEHGSDGIARLRVRSADEVVQTIRVRLIPVASAVYIAPGDLPPVCNPKDLDFQAAAAAGGRVPLSFDRNSAARLFPSLCRATSGLALGTLLASTRIIGMDCPGLHSIYSAVTLSWADEANGAAAPTSLEFCVGQAQERLSLLKLTLTAPGIEGTATAFYRPGPVRQISFLEAKQAVQQGMFGDDEALVIGGSRGLGELTAKLLAAGGGKVIVTYQAGRDDAEAVADEIRDGGGCCIAFPFDVLAPQSTSEAPPGLGHLNQVYFFAAPFIVGSSGRRWDRSLFDHFCDYFVEGMVNSVRALADVWGVKLGSLAVCQASTRFLDEPVANFAEYMAAKAAAEAAGRALAARHLGMRFLCPRLPRVLTDQTNAIIPVTKEQPIPLVLPILRAMHSP